MFSHLKELRAVPSKSANYESIYLERFQGTKPRTFLLTRSFVQCVTLDGTKVLLAQM